MTPFLPSAPRQRRRSRACEESPSDSTSPAGERLRALREEREPFGYDVKTSPAVRICGRALTGQSPGLGGRTMGRGGHPRLSTSGHGRRDSRHDRRHRKQFTLSASLLVANGAGWLLQYSAHQLTTAGTRSGRGVSGTVGGQRYPLVLSQATLRCCRRLCHAVGRQRRGGASAGECMQRGLKVLNKSSGR